MKQVAPLIAAMLLAACAQTPVATPAAAAPPPQAAVAPGPASMFVELTNPPNGTRIALKTGGELKLVMDADPQNATHWVGEEKPGPVLTRIGESVLVSKSMNVADNTAGAWNIFRYRAEKPGKITLELESRRFDAPGPALRTVRYEVTVE